MTRHRGHCDVLCETELAWPCTTAGQTKATRVVRLLAEDTIEASILKYQQRKLTAGGAASADEDSVLPQQDVDATTLATLMRDHPAPPTPK